MSIEKVLELVASNREQYIERLKELLRIPSISTDPDAKNAMRQAAQWVCAALAGAGLETEIAETGGHPAVVADSGPADTGGPTVLLYGHYDVQPVGDESLWETLAFEPAVRDGRLYARGSADDKGQFLIHVFAVEAWKKIAGRLPVRVKFLIEGEEEIGSRNLGRFLETHRDRLACDYVAISDTAKFSEKYPAITAGTKGMVYKELKLSGPAQDLHSGSFGGTVANPANILADVITSLKDADNRVTIPGFYDEVLELSATDRAEMAKLPFDDQQYLATLGSPALEGEAGFTTLERRWVRPTLDVNGIIGGFTGAGSSTIIPSKASAKVSMRLVPNQDPVRIGKAFDDAVRAATPASVRLEILDHVGCAAYVCPTDSPGMQAAIRAVEAGFGVRPFVIREGGSLPILPMFKKTLGADSILMGFALPNCNAHGPNEFLVLEDFYAGIRSVAQFLRELSAG